MSNYFTRLESKVHIGWKWAKDVVSGITTKNESNHDVNVGLDVTTAAAAAYVDQLYTGTYTIANAGSQILRLDDGSLKDFSGTAITITKLKLLQINVVSGGATVLGFTVTPYGGDATGPAFPVLFDNANDGTTAAKKKPIAVGGIYHEYFPGGYTLGTVTHEWCGIKLENNTGSSAVVNITIGGKA